MENKNVIAVNSVGNTENQCVAGGGHQLPILQLHAEFDLTQNPISVIITEDFTVGANVEQDLLVSGNFTMTVGGGGFMHPAFGQGAAYGYDSTGFYIGAFGSISSSNLTNGSSIVALYTISSEMGPRNWIEFLIKSSTSLTGKPFTLTSGSYSLSDTIIEYDSSYRAYRYYTGDSSKFNALSSLFQNNNGSNLNFNLAIK